MAKTNFRGYLKGDLVPLKASAPTSFQRGDLMPALNDVFHGALQQAWR
jgi:hypothetical protein